MALPNAFGQGSWDETQPSINLKNSLVECKGDKKQWNNCYAKIYDDGELKSEGAIIDKKKEGKWLLYPPSWVKAPPEVREYLNGYRIDGENAKFALQQQEKDKKNKAMWEQMDKRNAQFNKLMDCVSSGELANVCSKKFPLPSLSKE